MMGLILKDLLNIKNNMRTLIIVLAFYIVLAISVNDINLVSGMVVILFTMLSINSFSYDDLAKWDRCALSFPISRGEIVLSKYILSLCMAAAGALISLIISFGIMLYKKEVEIKELLLATYILFAIATFFISMIIPLLYKFGVEKSRIMIILVLGLPTLLLSFLAKSGIKINENFLIFLLKISPVLLIGILILSIFLSTAIYNNKEF